MKKYISEFTVMMIVLLVFACKKEVSDQSIKGSAEFVFNLSDNTLKSTGLDSVAAVVVSIENLQGKPVYADRQLKLYRINNSFISSPLIFETGNFKITKFLVIDKNGNVLYATPVSGSSKAYLVKNPLPLIFSIGKYAVTQLSLEVISTYAGKPKDFGYSGFTFEIIETYSFRINVFVYDSISKGLVMTDANLKVFKDSLNYLERNITPGSDTLVLPDTEKKYIFMVTKAGYNPWIDTLTRTQLIEYSLKKAITVMLLRYQSITLQLYQMQIPYKVYITMNGNGSFMVFRGNASFPGDIFTLSGMPYISTHTLTDPPDVLIKGDIDQITEFKMDANYLAPGIAIPLFKLDVHMATSLKKLYLRPNALTELDLTHNRLLESVTIEANCLSQMDLSQNTELLYFTMDGGLYNSSSIRITSMDFRLNTKLKEIKLNYLNYLSHIMLDNDDLVTLELKQTVVNRIDISHCPNLEKFIIEDLYSLDISNNIKLDDILWISNRLGGMNQFYIDLLANVRAHPRQGHLSSPFPSGAGLTAKQQLIDEFGWSVDNFPD